MEGYLPALTHITNRSLDTNQFCEEWKEALVKPLIKKPSAGLEKTNYRLVSNLGFISQVVMKLHYLPNTVMRIDYYPHFSQHIGEITVARLV